MGVPFLHQFCSKNVFLISKFGVKNIPVFYGFLYKNLAGRSFWVEFIFQLFHLKLSFTSKVPKYTTKLLLLIKPIKQLSPTNINNKTNLKKNMFNSTKIESIRVFQLLEVAFFLPNPNFKMELC